MLLCFLCRVYERENYWKSFFLLLDRTSASRGFSQSIKSNWTSWETSSMSPDFPCGAWSERNCWTALTRDKRGARARAVGTLLKKGCAAEVPVDSWKWWVEELDSFPSETWPLKLWPLFLWKVMDMYFRGSFWIWISFNIKTSWELFVRFLGCPVKSTVLQSTLNSIFNPV